MPVSPVAAPVAVALALRLPSAPRWRREALCGRRRGRPLPWHQHKLHAAAAGHIMSKLRPSTDRSAEFIVQIINRVIKLSLCHESAMPLKEYFAAPSNGTKYMQQISCPAASSTLNLHVCNVAGCRGRSRCSPQHIPIQLAAVHVRPGPLSVLSRFKLHIGKTTGQVHHLQMHKVESAK